MRIPADWEPHQRCWIGIPGIPELWQKRFFAARQTVIDLANKIIDHEPVNLLCPPRYGNFLKSYTDSRIEIVEADYSESWIRDITPTYVETKKGKVKAVFSTSNSNLPSYKLMRRLMCRHINIASETIDLTIENGSFTTDGQGTAICIKNTIFSNRSNDQSIIEKQLAEKFGIEKVIWINRALMNDHVPNHVTNLVRFVHPSIVLLANHGNLKDPNKGVCIDTFDQLSDRNTRDIAHKNLSVYQVHNPPPMVYKGSKLNASYTNFYIANKAVFIPGFYKPKYDRRALELYQGLFPGYEIIQHQILPLLTGGGGIHCVACPQLLGRKMLSQQLIELENLDYQQQSQQDIKQA